MRVEYDEQNRQFRIYKTDHDLHYVAMPYNQPVREVDVVSETEFVITGQFGEKQRYNSDGRLVV